ncbi:MAG: ABC transporter substrate-binding protein [Rhodobacteraceae bacterium]|nr:ABC transporter substrate-binding protein [Paracoccaceae bacterium]
MKRNLLMLATALGALPVAAGATDVTILYTASAPFVAVYVAVDQGFFANHGVNATMQLVQNGSVAVSGIVSGSAQVGLPTPTVVMQAIDNGLDLRIFGATNIFPDNTAAGLVVTPESGITDAASMNGHMIGVPGIGGLLDVVMRKWVDENGGDSTTLNIVEYALPQTADVLRGHQMDGVASLDPFLSRAVDSGAGVFIGNYTDVIPAGTVAGVMTVTADWAADNVEAIAGMQAALDEAAAFIGDHPDEARAAIAHYTTLPPPVVAGLTLPNLSDLHVTPAGFAFWQDLAVAQGLIGGPVDLDHMVIPFAGN